MHENNHFALIDIDNTFGRFYDLIYPIQGQWP